MKQLIDIFGYMYVVYVPFVYSMEDNCEIGFSYKPGAIDIRHYKWIYQYG